MLQSNDTIKRRKKGGFTLIEIIVAMAILAGGIVGLVATFRMGLYTAGNGKHASEAAILASNIISTATAVPADQCNPSTGNSGEYTWTLLYESKQHNLMMASVQINWTQLGMTRSFQLSRIFLPRQ